jgi:hypothetical protein
MADGQIVILDNSGDDNYNQSAREFLVSPIVTDLVRIILNDASQLDNVLKIKNYKSFGSESNRDISLRQYISAKRDTTNLIIDVPIDPPVRLDGQTYFQTTLAANSEMDLLFYFDQMYIESLLV